MAAIDEVHEIVGRAEAAGDREIANGLISPGGVERMFHDGHELDMRIAQVLHVGNQVRQPVPVGQPAVPSSVFAAPGARRGLRRWTSGNAASRALGARFEPVRIVPLVAIDIADDRGGVRPQFCSEPVRIGFQPEVMPDARKNLEFVERALVQPGHEEFPDPTRAAIAHGLHAPVPEIEIADDAHPLGVRRPDGEMHASDARNFANMRAELFVFW